MKNKVIPFDMESFSKLEAYQIKALEDLHNPWAIGQLVSVEEHEYGELPGYGFTGKIEFPRDVVGYEAWYKNGLFHRQEEHAVRYGHARWWYICGRQHCATGPAFISDSGIKEWFLYGKKVTAQDVFEQLPPELKEKAIWEINEWH